MSDKKIAQEERTGTQSIERAVALLCEIGTRGQFGWQLADIADHCNLSRSTAHRILDCLVRERLVSKMPENRHYRPGPMMFELGLALPEFGDLQFIARNHLEELAKRTSGVAFLFFRSGDDFVCAVRVGKLKMKALTIFPGTRRPLAASAGGAAILLALDVPVAHEIITRNLVNLRNHGFSKDRSRSIFRMLERTHGEGFAVNAGDIVPGVHAFGHALLDEAGEPFASVVLAGSPQIFPLEDVPKIREKLHKIAKELEVIPRKGTLTESSTPDPVNV